MKIQTAFWRKKRTKTQTITNITLSITRVAVLIFLLLLLSYFTFKQLGITITQLYDVNSNGAHAICKPQKTLSTEQLFTR